MKAYTVQRNLAHNQVDYTPTHRIDLEDAEATSLVELGVITEGYDGDEPSTSVTNTNTNEGPKTPTDAVERLNAISQAIGSLDANNDDLWSKSGHPTVEAITAVTGWKVSAAERDQVWKQIQDMLKTTTDAPANTANATSENAGNENQG